MKTKRALLLAIITSIVVVSAEAQYTASTLNITSVSWGNGSAFDCTPAVRLSLDLNSGNALDGVAGPEGIGNWYDRTDAFCLSGFDTGQSFDSLANEMASVSSSRLFYRPHLDWRRSSSTLFYVGAADGQSSSAARIGAPEDDHGTRHINHHSSMLGLVLDPALMTYAGFGFITLAVVQRRK